MVYRAHGWGVAFDVPASASVTASPVWVGLLSEGAKQLDPNLTGEDLIEAFVVEVVNAIGRRDHAPTGSREVQRWLASYVDPLVVAAVRAVQPDGASDWIPMSVDRLPVQVRLGAGVLVAACLHPELCPTVVDTIERTSRS